MVGGGGSTEQTPPRRVPATDRVSVGRGAWRLQEKAAANPDANEQRVPKRGRPITPPDRPMTRSMTQSAANDPEPSAFLKAMFFFKEAEKAERASVAHVSVAKPPPKRLMTSMPAPGMPPSKMVPLGMPPPGMPPAVEGRLRPPKRLMSMPAPGMPPMKMVSQGMPPPGMPPGMPPAEERLPLAPKRPVTKPPPGMPPPDMPPAGMPPSGTVPPGMPPAEERLPPPRLVGSVASQIRQLNSVAPHGQPAAPLGPVQISAEAPGQGGGPVTRQKKAAGRKEEDLWSRRVEMQWCASLGLGLGLRVRVRPLVTPCGDAVVR